MSCKSTLTAFALALTALGASANPISPTFGSFGAINDATFGGSGIPNTPIAISSSSGDLTIGLSATQRYVGANLANDGNGTYTAFAGTSTFAPSPSNPYATWNFNFYTAGADTSDLQFQLEYDFNAAAGNDETTHGKITVGGSFISGGQFPSQASWNLGMDFLANSVTGLVAPVGVFDPNAIGEYTFRLSAYGTGPTPVAQSAIRVNVIGPNRVPEPATLALVGVALLGAGLARRRR